MCGQRGAEHDAVRQSRMLAGGAQTFPTRGPQTEAAFCPGEVTFNHGAEFEMKTPLSNKGQGCQGFLALLAEIAVNHPAGLQDRAKVIQKRKTKVSGIGAYQRN